MDASIAEQIKEGKALLVDVRTKEEWDAGHASPATHFDVERIAQGEFPPIPKDMPVYLYCRSGHRAGIAANILKKNGFNATNLGGLSDWKAMGGEVKS